jgi:choline kinase
VVEGLQGAILAAGQGQRLRKVIADLPKPLVELNGETLLARQARAMVEAGVRSVVAVVNSETAGLIKSRRPTLPVELRLCVRDTPNSMESLFTLGEHLSPGRFLLATVDAVMSRRVVQSFTARALEIMDAQDGRSTDGVLGVVQWRGDERPLFVKISPNGFVRALDEEKSNLVTAGIYLLPTRIFDFVAQARATGLDAMRRFLAMLLEHRMRFGVFELPEAIDVDEAPDLEAARAMLERQRGSDEGESAAESNVAARNVR